MSSDFERRLARALRDGAPAGDVTDRARAVVVAAAPSGRPWRRGRTMVGGLLAAVTVTAGAAMAATGNLIPESGVPAPEPPRLAVAEGRSAAVGMADGRAWVATAAGVRHSRSATAVELSPAGLFVAFGTRGSLVAAELDGDTRWKAVVRGDVVQIAWAPYPTYIAYVVRRGRHHDLRVIWANGRNDRLVARNVAPTRPRWRADTGAVFYTARDGRAWTWEREPDRLVPRRGGTTGS